MIKKYNVNDVERLYQVILKEVNEDDYVKVFIDIPEIELQYVNLHSENEYIVYNSDSTYTWYKRNKKKWRRIEHGTWQLAGAGKNITYITKPKHR